VQFKQDVLDEAFLASFVTFSAGDAFDNRQVLSLRQSLSGSGYFADVRVQTGTPDDATLTVPLEVIVNAKPQYVYSAGVGFATDTGPRLRLGIENRRSNRLGHRYGTELELSPIRSGIGGNYDIPLGDPNRERISFISSYSQEDLEDHSSERFRVGAAHLRELDSDWLVTRGLDFEREYFIVGEQKDRTDLVMPGLELTKVVADNPIYPQRGWRLNGKTRFAHENIASSVTFLQVRGNAKYVQPVWYGRLLMRLEAGATLVNELTELPSSVRFFAGGDSSIRGYAYQSLGPKEDAINNTGDVIGGRHLLVASIEYDIPFQENWSVAIFNDGGNAYDKLADFEPVYGRGAGIRWRSPIGPVRLDVAEPSDGSDNFRLHISMGMDL
jgi:translocation and assembly module TamA